MVVHLRRVLCCVLALSAGACGGSSSSSSPTSPSNTGGVTLNPAQPTSLGWAVTNDPGVRATPTSSPAAITIGTQTCLFYGPGVLVSSDGVNFSSAGVIQVPVNSGLISVVVLPSGLYRMYYALPSIGAGFAYVTSVDGLHYCDSQTGTCAAGSALNGTALSGTPSGTTWMRVVAMPSGGFRAFYGGSDSAIHSMFSTDGVTFTEEGVRVSGGGLGFFEPSVVYLPGVGWLMSMSTQGRQQGYDDIYLATSIDGVTWTADTGPTLASSTGNSYYYSSLIATGSSTARIYADSNAGMRAYTGGAALSIVSGTLAKTTSTTHGVTSIMPPPVGISRSGPKSGNSLR